ncbi:DUF3243 domain-containing protein [Oceanobacillus chungangensis]|uniref:DUF3243 domain-containing protein n=1 Tax=Oceanobacillus chungangensis TaxID=1229152 RepID=A0A3D8PL59_9BACI|nr:DUF3243 domain-containing protein [Oceanobacillus chungangensis]RDW15989.1 DUF3243 domain-containing protein [Oceanobacillus chungangensis]
MSVLDNFDTWKDFLGNRLQQAQNNGMDEGIMSTIAAEIGDYLAANVEPKNDEQRLLADLWHSADENQKQVLANTMINLVKNKNAH